jgi:hypothetical protein
VQSSFALHLEIGMKVMNVLLHAATSMLVSLIAFGVAAAADYPPPMR